MASTDSIKVAIGNVTSNGSLSIPKDVKRWLNLEKGDQLFFFWKNGVVTLQKVDDLTLERIHRPVPDNSEAQHEDEDLVADEMEHDTEDDEPVSAISSQAMCVSNTDDSDFETPVMADEQMHPQQTVQNYATNSLFATAPDDYPAP